MESRRQGLPLAAEAEAEGQEDRAEATRVEAIRHRLLAAFGAFLGRWAGEECVRVAIDPGEEGPTGKLVSVDLSDNPSAGELQRRVRESLRDATPPAAPIPFEVALIHHPSPGRGSLELRYDAHLFDEATAEAMLESILALYTWVTIGRAGGLAEVPLLSGADHELVVVEWNRTAGVYPREATIPGLFSEQAARQPDSPALVFGEVILTYGELDERSGALAERLRALGVGPDVLVGVFLERCPALLVALLGALKAGGAYVPLDPDYPEERLAFMLEDTRTPVIITREGLRDRLSPGPTVLCLDASGGTFVDGPAGRGATMVAATPASVAVLGDTEPAASPPALGPLNLAYVSYTSGSTGRPKGVGVPHRAVIRLVRNTDYVSLGPEDTFLQVSRVSFDASTLEIWGPLLNGGRVAMAPPGPLSPREIGETIRRYGVTAAFLTTGLFNVVVETNLSALTGLGRLLFGGDAASPRHVLKAARGLAECRLVNGYGPTENTTFTTCYQVGRDWADAGAGGGPTGHEVGADLEAEWRTVPIGKPIRNTTVYLLDGRMNPVPVGVPGELFTGGDGLARGYHDRPDLTAERFVPDPFSSAPGARLYRTGDLVRYRRDGTIEFLGRLDHQVKIRGFRVELGEIEAVLGGHPSVREVVVVAREERPGDKRLVAYIVPLKDAPKPDLRAYLADRLPDWMTPSTFVFVDAFPLGPTGKVDRGALPVPAGLRPDLSTIYAPPETAVEKALCDLWAEILRVDLVGIDDDLFELGGDSLLATRIISRVREGMGREVSLRCVFEGPTVRALARVCEAAAPAETPVETPGAETSSVEDAFAEAPSPEASWSAPTEPAPLSFAQRRLLFFDRMLPGSALYNIPCTVRLRGRLDAPALGRALDEIVRRHETLRTVFRFGPEGEPFGLPDAAPPMVPRILDLTSMNPDGREAQARRLAEEEVRGPFDLSRGPLLRCLLIRLDPEDHLLVLTIHHIAADGWSMGVFIRELTLLYEREVLGREVVLPDLPVPYSEYAVRQRERLRGAALDDQVGYWREKLEALPPVLELPLDYPRPATQSFRGALQVFSWPRSLLARLDELCRAEGVTRFMVLLAAFQALLYRYSRRADAPVGVAVANRTRAEVEDLIGFFVNTLVIRGEMGDDPSFRTHLRRVRDTSLEAYAYQDLPFDMLVDLLNPERDPSYMPLVQVLFAFQNAPLESLELAGLQAAEVEIDKIDTGTSKTDLVVTVEETSQGLGGYFQYRTDLFSHESVGRMIRHYEALLNGAVDDPESRLSRLPLLGPDEVHLQTGVWSQAAAPYPADATIPSLFRERAGDTPAAPAVRSNEGAMTYAQLDARSDAAAAYLQGLGVTRETLVGVSLERSPGLIVALLAILKAGAAYLPLDPDYPDERWRYMIADAGLSTVITSGPLMDRFRSLDGITLVTLDRELPADGPAERPDERPADPGASPDDLAYVVYTSGSTGRPKGVGVPHRAVIRLVRGQRFASYAPEEIFLQFAPVSFDASTFEIWGPLLNGASLVVAPSGPLSPAEFGEVLQANGVTTTFLTTGLFNLMVETRAEALTGLRRLVFGGDVASAQHVRRAVAKLPDTVLLNGYGPTENTTFTTCWEVPRDAGAVPGAVPIGRPISNTTVYVLDQRMHLIPAGHPGELFTGGDGLARGYHRRPELTAERFVPDPFSRRPGARLYRTGDLVRYLPTGDLEFIGRIDGQVKVRGFRVELGEVEAALREHPAVRDAAVVVREDRPGEKRLVAYTVPERAESAGAGLDLRIYLAGRLPEWMLPSTFVALDALPLGPTGKVDRRALPAPDVGRESEPGGRALTPTEEALSRLWKEILGPVEIGPEDSFFHLGGQSLLAMRLSVRVGGLFGVEVPLREIFERPALAAMAAMIEEKLVATPDAALPPGAEPADGGEVAASTAAASTASASTAAASTAAGRGSSAPRDLSQVLEDLTEEELDAFLLDLMRERKRAP